MSGARVGEPSFALHEKLARLRKAAQMPYGFRIIEMLDLHYEANGISALAAAEALIDSLSGIYRERCSLLGMKGQRPQRLPPERFKST